MTPIELLIKAHEEMLADIREQRQEEYKVWVKELERLKAKQFIVTSMLACLVTEFEANGFAFEVPVSYITEIQRKVLEVDFNEDRQAFTLFMKDA